MTITISRMTGQDRSPKQQMDSAAAKSHAAFLLTLNPIFIDTETTGLDHAAEVTEVACIDSDGNVLLDTLVKPKGKLSEEAARVTHITEAMLAHAPAYPEVYEALRKLVQGRHLVFYNAAFDMRIIQQNAAALQIADSLSWASVTCAMQLFSSFAALPGRFKGSYKWHKLNEAADMLQVFPEEALHRALADTDLTRKLLIAMKDRVEL